jgi:hypothetical protein
MEQGFGEYDEVMKVLLECELKLRLLQQQGRLTGEGLREFVELSTKVRAEIDRRHQPDRRGALRSAPDRRAANGVVSRRSIEPV